MYIPIQKYPIRELITEVDVREKIINTFPNKKKLSQTFLPPIISITKMEHGSKNTRVTRVTLSGGICKCSLSEIPVWRKKLLNLVHIYIFWEKCCKIRQLMNPLLQFMFYKRFYLVSMPNFLSPPISFTLLWKTNCMVSKANKQKTNSFTYLSVVRSAIWGISSSLGSSFPIFAFFLQISMCDSQKWEIFTTNTTHAPHRNLENSNE